MRTLVIGDLHGHLDRFEALLRQESLLERCTGCEGNGQIYASQGGGWIECEPCGGDGWRRVRRDEVEVVLAGDIGHFGVDGSPTGDMLTYRAANLWADVRLWGNHDRAVVDGAHEFSGYLRPIPETRHYMAMADLKLAYAARGFLITHAGLHAAFQHQRVPPEVKTDPAVFADWINAVSDMNTEATVAQSAVRDAIGAYRGGGANGGGILWRDIDEKLYDGFRQVFGHSPSREHIVRYAHRNWYTGKPFVAQAAPEDTSYCIDIGGKGTNPGDRCLAGIYLPSEKIVRIDL